MQKNPIYFIRNKYGLVFRPAFVNDDMDQIGRLIYGTDPYIYPYWMPNRQKFIKFIKVQLVDPDYIFHYQHVYVVSLAGDKNILGIVTLLEPGKPLSIEINPHLREQYLGNRHQTVCKDYLQKLAAQHQALKADEVIISHFCVDPGFRKMLIGTTFMEIIFEELQRTGYHKVFTDCLCENQVAMRLYQRVGCRIVGEGFGFGGDQPDPQIYHLVKEL